MKVTKIVLPSLVSLNFSLWPSSLCYFQGCKPGIFFVFGSGSVPLLIKKCGPSSGSGFSYKLIIRGVKQNRTKPKNPVGLKNFSNIKPEPNQTDGKLNTFVPNWNEPDPAIFIWIEPRIKLIFTTFENQNLNMNPAILGQKNRVRTLKNPGFKSQKNL